MNRETSSALKKFAKRHHLWFQTGITHDELVPPTSVFRQRNTKDLALATGIVDDTDMMFAQRRFRMRKLDPSKDDDLILTICSSELRGTEHQLLFVNENLPSEYSLTIRHLRRQWPHSHWPNGYLFIPAHAVQAPNKRLQQNLNDCRASVELIENIFTVVMSPALTEDSTMEELLNTTKRLRALLLQN